MGGRRGNLLLPKPCWEGWKRTNKWWSENQELLGEWRSHEPFRPRDNGMSLGWNKNKIYLLYIQMMGVPVPSWIIERIGESLVVATYIEYLGGERMQLEECCVPRFFIANVRAGAFLGACLVI